jgi:hypothetical protein
MHFWVAVLCLVLAKTGLAVVPGNPDEELRDVSMQIRPALAEAEGMLADGQLDQASACVLKRFPEATRTSVQALMLGNVLFHLDPKLSYALHKRAAAELPTYAHAQLEWALEQHRAGEYAGAATAYQIYVKEKPDHAPPLGLLAECLIRQGKIQEACAAWSRSEAARVGTITEFESMVCEMHFHQYPERDRAELLRKVKGGDVAAAEKLMLLDLSFPRDWWNTGPHTEYLTKDLAVCRKLRSKDARHLSEVLVTAECVLAAENKAELTRILKRSGYLIDDRGTLPANEQALCTLLQTAISAEVVTEEDAKAKWGQILRERAKTAKTAAAYNLAAHFYLGTDQLPEIDRLGWVTTGDERFAASYLLGLLGLLAKGTLTAHDPELRKASEQFPESATIAGIVVHLCQKSNQPRREPLIRAIKAEFSHFSPQNPSFPRAGAAALRKYFSLLREEIKPR